MAAQHKIWVCKEHKIHSRAESMVLTSAQQARYRPCSRCCKWMPSGASYRQLEAIAPPQLQVICSTGRLMMTKPGVGIPLTSNATQQPTAYLPAYQGPTASIVQRLRPCPVRFVPATTTAGPSRARCRGPYPWLQILCISQPYGGSTVQLSGPHQQGCRKCSPPDASLPTTVTQHGRSQALWRLWRLSDLLYST